MATETKRVPIPSRGVDYRRKVVLAPMVRSGELPSRLTALHYGADLVWGPETVDRAMIGTTRRINHAANTIDWVRRASQGSKPAGADGLPPENAIYRIHPEREKGKHIFQVGTSNPELAVQAARLVAADVSGIDVNAGCPKPFSTHDGMGAALLRTPDKLCAILDALVREIIPEFNIGISVKIRLLETAPETEALVRRLVATGIHALTVHCRTTPMRPRERAIRGQLKMVAEVCREAGVACLMNGDVASREQAAQLVPEFGVDGAMIATSAETNFSCFRPAEEGGLAPWEEVAKQFFRYALEVDNKFSNTKFLLAQIVPGKAPVTRSMAPSRSYSRVCEVLGYADLADRAREVDVARGIDPDGHKKDASGGASGNKKNNKKKSATALAAGGQMREPRQQGKSLSERGPERQAAASV